MPTNQTISPSKMIFLGIVFVAGFFTLMLTLTPRFANPQTLSNVQSDLIIMAAEHPNMVVRVMVQKADADINIEELIPRLGGTVIQIDFATNIVVAEMSAEMAVALAGTDGVSWINLDAKVAES